MRSSATNNRASRRSSRPLAISHRGNLQNIALRHMMQNRSRRVVGRRALIKGAAMLAVAATARAQGQPPPAEQATTLADVPLGPSVTVTVESRRHRARRPQPPVHSEPDRSADAAAVGRDVLSIRARYVAPCARAVRPRREFLARY